VSCSLHAAVRSTVAAQVTYLALFLPHKRLTAAKCIFIGKAIFEDEKSIFIVLSCAMTRNNKLGGKAIFEDEAEDDEYVDGSRATTPETVSLLKLYKDLSLSFPSKLLLSPLSDSSSPISIHASPSVRKHALHFKTTCSCMTA